MYLHTGLVLKHYVWPLCMSDSKAFVCVCVCYFPLPPTQVWRELALKMLAESFTRKTMLRFSAMCLGSICRTHEPSN